jgi:tRNA (guanine-N7-)-methyltransferase
MGAYTDMAPQSDGNSSPIYSNQQGINRDLLKFVAKYASGGFEKPIAKHTADAFLQLHKITAEVTQPIILDSGCGTGESSYALSEQFPGHMVIGIDKSAARLSKSMDGQHENVLLVRAELIDMWRLMREHHWQIDAHFLFYPNPWPKQQHLKRRWHGHPEFLSMLQMSRYLELRTNWEIYAMEFIAAIEYLIAQGLVEGSVSITSFDPIKPVSRFEQKYSASGHQLFQVKHRRACGAS